jgi:hypothetical protein
MTNDGHQEVWINGHKFIDVTNMTVSGTVYNYAEAYALTQGRHITTSGYSKPPNPPEDEGII